jgi:hypothetical protein
VTIVYDQQPPIISQLLDQCGFVLLKALEFVAFKYPAENRDVFFKAYVAQRMGPNQEGSSPSVAADLLRSSGGARWNLSFPGRHQ